MLVSLFVTRMHSVGPRIRLFKTLARCSWIFSSSPLIVCRAGRSHLFVPVSHIQKDFQTQPCMNILNLKVRTSKISTLCLNSDQASFNSLFAYCSNLKAKVAVASFLLSAPSLCCCLRLSGFIYLSVFPSPPLQHISSRRHKDRAAGKPAKPKFSPYTPTQRHQSFQAVSTPLLLDLFSLLIIVFVYMSRFSRAFSRKLHSLLPMKQIISDMGLRNLMSEMHYSCDVRTKRQITLEKRADSWWDCWVITGDNSLNLYWLCSC